MRTTVCRGIVHLALLKVGYQETAECQVGRRKEKDIPARTKAKTRRRYGKDDDTVLKRKHETKMKSEKKKSGEDIIGHRLVPHRHS